MANTINRNIGGSPTQGRRRECERRQRQMMARAVKIHGRTGVWPDWTPEPAHDPGERIVFRGHNHIVVCNGVTHRMLSNLGAEEPRGACVCASIDTRTPEDYATELLDGVQEAS